MSGVFESNSIINPIEIVNAVTNSVKQSLSTTNDNSSASFELDKSLNNIYKQSNGLNSHLMADISIDLELSFRSIIQELIEQSIINNTEMSDNYSINSYIIRLIRFSFTYTTSKLSYSQACVKIPFLLIEDLINAMTIDVAELFWETVEELSVDITKPDLFSKGQLIILRVCNSLLRKLSKTYNTEFCGRILMFLSSVYALSEKSALNAGGLINTSNITTFDSEDDFLTTMSSLTTDESTSTSRLSLDVEVNELTNGSYSLPKPSDIITNQPDDAIAKSFDYNLYKTFWSLQSYFSNDNKSLDTIDKWTSLITSIDSVFSLFQSTSLTNEETSSDISVDSSLDSLLVGNTYTGCKYLTSAKLLGLQLRDPLFRQQIATQILFYIYNIRSKPPPVFTPPEPAPSIISTKGKSSSNSKSAALIAAAAAAAVTQATNLKNQLASDTKTIEDKAFATIENSPRGQQLASYLRILLHRETHYQTWKNNGCPPFEKYSNPSISIPDDNYSTSWSDTTSGVPRFIDHKKLDMFNNQISKQKRQYAFSVDIKSVVEYAKALVEEVPSFDKFIQDYLEAEDPENGIEESYHPKHNSLYCWKARRLLANKRLRVFENMADGNISNGLIKLGVLTASRSEDTATSNEIVDDKETSSNEPKNEESVVTMQ